MILIEKSGLPVAYVLASAQPHELTLAPQVLAAMAIPQGRGRPRKHPQRLVADRGYDSEPFRQQLRRTGITPCIPKRMWGRQTPCQKLSGPPGYRQRWIVERTFAWYGNSRRLLVRHERLLPVYEGFFLVATILMALRKFRNHRRK